MNSGKLAVVFRYEFLKMAKTKTFLVTTLLGPFLIVAVAVLPSIIAMKTMDRSHDVLQIGLLSRGEAEARVMADILAPAITAKGWNYRVSADEAALRADTLSGDLDGYLKLPEGFPSDAAFSNPEGERPFGWFSKNGADLFVFDAVKGLVSSAVVSERLAGAGVEESWARSLLAPVDLPVYRLNEGSADGGAAENTEDAFLTTLLTGVFFCMIIYMTVLLYGQQTGRSVVAEKSSKIVDILLSSARAEDILFGKILGIGLAGLVQYAAWGCISAAALALLGPVFGVTLPVTVGIGSFAWLAAFFVAGYLLFASFYASFGAASEDDQHMAQLSMPVIFVLVIPMVMMQAFIQRPDSPVAVVLSYVPFTSPMVMMIRLSVGAASVAEGLASLAVLAASVIGSGFLAAKIFRTGLLMSGKNFNFKDIAGWLRA